MVRKLRLWSEERLGIVLQDIGDALPHGKQDDWTDCGIIAVNTAIRQVLDNQPLWTPRYKCIERVCWFLTLLYRHVLDVSERRLLCRKES